MEQHQFKAKWLANPSKESLLKWITSKVETSTLLDLTGIQKVPLMNSTGIWLQDQDKPEPSVRDDGELISDRLRRDNL